MDGEAVEETAPRAPLPGASAEIWARLGSSVAFGSGCGQSLPGSGGAAQSASMFMAWIQTTATSNFRKVYCRFDEEAEAGSLITLKVRCGFAVNHYARSV